MRGEINPSPYKAKLGFISSYFSSIGDPNCWQLKQPQEKRAVLKSKLESVSLNGYQLPALEKCPGTRSRCPGQCEALHEPSTQSCCQKDLLISCVLCKGMLHLLHAGTCVSMQVQQALTGAPACERWEMLGADDSRQNGAGPGQESHQCWVCLCNDLSPFPFVAGTLGRFVDARWGLPLLQSCQNHKRRL